MGPAGAMGLEEDDGADGFAAAPALSATEGLPQLFTDNKSVKAASAKAASRIRRA
jgi:hypothetical protein